MNKRTLFAAVLITGCYMNMSAQQFLPEDVAGDKEYIEICKEYELSPVKSIDLLNEFLDKYPDTRHKNRIESLIASAYFNEGKYKEAIALFNSCDIDALADKERDAAAYKLASAYLKEDDLQKSSVWFSLLKDVSKEYKDDAIYNLAYIDYVQKRYDKALQGFIDVQNSESYKEKATIYIGEIYLLKNDYRQASDIVNSYIKNAKEGKIDMELYRIDGEALFEMGRYNDCIKRLQQYISSTSSPKRKPLYDLGMAYYNTSVYSKAAEAFDKVTGDNDALSQNAYLHMGLSYLNLKERNMARMAFEQAAVSNAGMDIKEKALYNYALLVHETSYSPFAESVTVFERFLNEFPNSVYADKINDYLVEVYMNTRSYEAALKSIAKIKQPGKVIQEAKQKILFRLGTQAFANSKFDEALNLFDQSLALGQYNLATKADAFYWKGETEYRLGNYNQAINSFKNFFSVGTDRKGEEYSLALYNMGYCYFKKKEYSLASEWFRKFVNTPSNNSVMLADAYNRIGDSYFYTRQFDSATKNYAAAAATDRSLADYSLYQEAFVKGLQRDYNGKISLLNNLLKDFPQSQYIDDAIYEQGRAFVQMEDNNNAINRFNILVSRYPESNMARRAASEIGLLYYQDDKYTDAIEAYKKVISNYPGSDEARLAQRDLKSIYIDLNKVDEYAAFASTIPGGISFDVNERDSLTYIASEKIYMRGEIDAAKSSFVRYLQSFPNGAFNLNANYYLGLIDYNRKDYDNASKYLDKVLEYPSNKYSEDALIINAAIAYNRKNYDRSLTLYKLLKDKTVSAEKRETAELGILRSAHYINDNKEVINSASGLLGIAKLSPEIANEAHYYRAKAYELENNMIASMDDWKFLANDTRNVYGAEGKYKIGQIYFDQGNMDDAEKEILNYIEISTPHTYWLARGFILLSDIYMKRGKNMEAKQYLLSLKQNYDENAEINNMIKLRLDKLGNIK